MVANIFFFLGKVVAGAIIGAVTAPVILSALGFGSAGVAAGSLAAFIQSTIGNVAAGSLFAALQSAGAAGIATGTIGVLATSGAVVAATLPRVL